MKLLLLPALLSILPFSSSAAPSVRLRGARAEDALRRLTEEGGFLRERLSDVVRREEAFLAESRDADLRDSVADFSESSRLAGELASAAGPERARLLAVLPGMAAGPDAAACRSLSDCAAPELAADVSDPRELPGAVRRLVRPFLLLQQARGAALEISPAADADAVLRLGPGPGRGPLTLNISPRLTGGFKVWYDQPFLVAVDYARARDAALRR